LALSRLITRLEGTEDEAVQAAPLFEEGELWSDWLTRRFPRIATFPLADRHKRLWRFFVELKTGVKPVPEVHVMPRGGAKSSSVRMATAYVCGKLTRRFVLYVSGTQKQADDHVTNIAKVLLDLGIEREINQFGQATGWRRSEIHCANGFVVRACGLDSDIRGLTTEEQRPDLIVFDDIDGRHDTAATTSKKKEIITTSILPAGSIDCAVVFIQNLVIENGIMAELASPRRTFMRGCYVSPIEPAVRGLEYTTAPQEDGSNVFVITGGEPSWAGQSLTTCEAQLNEWGDVAFLREAQHMVREGDGEYFKVDQLRTITLDELPTLVKIVDWYDFAATEGGGDYTSMVRMGKSGNGNLYILKVVNQQWGTEKVEQLLKDESTELYTRYPSVNKLVGIPQDPAAAGKWVVANVKKLLKRHLPGCSVKSRPVFKKKAIRAQAFAAKVNLGNVAMLEGEWNWDFSEQLRKFKADESHEYDDMVDAAADGARDLLDINDQAAATVKTQARAQHIVNPSSGVMRNPIATETKQDGGLFVGQFGRKPKPGYG